MIYGKIHKDKLERELDGELDTINVLHSDLDVLKRSYKENFGIEADEDTLLFGRKVIVVKL